MNLRHNEKWLRMRSGEDSRSTGLYDQALCAPRREVTFAVDDSDVQTRQGNAIRCKYTTPTYTGVSSSHNPANVLNLSPSREVNMENNGRHRLDSGDSMLWGKRSALEVEDDHSGLALNWELSAIGGFLFCYASYHWYVYCMIGSR